MSRKSKKQKEIEDAIKQRGNQEFPLDQYLNQVFTSLKGPVEMAEKLQIGGEIEIKEKYGSSVLVKDGIMQQILLQNMVDQNHTETEIRIRMTLPIGIAEVNLSQK